MRRADAPEGDNQVHYILYHTPETDQLFFPVPLVELLLGLCRGLLFRPLPSAQLSRLKDRGKRGGRYHHHITVNGGIDRDTLESMWEYGYANSRRLQFTEDGLAGLGNYIVKSPVGGKAWTASKNLVDPEPRTRDGPRPAFPAR